MCQKKTPTGIHGSLIWKLFCHDVSLNAIVQNVSKRELKIIKIKKNSEGEMAVKVNKYHFDLVVMQTLEKGSQVKDLGTQILTACG